MSSRSPRFDWCRRKHGDHAEHEPRKGERNQHFNERESLMPLVSTSFRNGQDANWCGAATCPSTRAASRFARRSRTLLAVFLAVECILATGAIRRPGGLHALRCDRDDVRVGPGCRFGDARTGRDGSAYHPRAVPGVRAQQAVAKFALIARHDGHLGRAIHRRGRYCVVTDVQQRLLAIGIDAFDHFLRDHDRLCTLEELELVERCATRLRARAQASRRQGSPA